MLKKRTYKFAQALTHVTPRLAAQIILVGAGILVLLTFRQYGVTWDEELQSQYGLAVVDYYTSLFKDQRYAEIFNLYLYGGMFDGMASIVDRFTPFNVYETRHLINGFTGLLGLWGTWRLGKWFGGGGAGLLALILLLITPMYYGHMFNNPKDVPFAAGVVWSLYYMARCFDAFAKRKESSRERWDLTVKLGVVYGLTLGIRVGGIMILAFWFAALGLEVLRTRFHLETIKRLLRLVVPVVAIAYVVMLFCWPWAQQHPISNPLRAISEFSNFPQDVEVLLNGTIYRSTELPWYYVPLYFGVQLPLLLLFLLAVSLILMPWMMRSSSWQKKQALTLLLLSTFFPILYAVIRHPALYDAVRHFLFVVPLVCVLSAIAALRVHAWAVNEFWQTWSRRGVTLGMLAVLIIAGGTQIYTMIRLHPYEYIYANQLVGGVPGAYSQYEMDYWGSSFKEAAEELQAFVAKEGGIPDGKIYRIAICGPWDSAMIYLPPDYEPVVADKPAEFFLSTTRWMCQNMRPGKEIIRVKRLGVPLSIIKDLRGGYETYGPNTKKPAKKKAVHQ